MGSSGREGQRSRQYSLRKDPGHKHDDINNGSFVCVERRAFRRINYNLQVCSCFCTLKELFGIGVSDEERATLAFRDLMRQVSNSLHCCLLWSHVDACLPIAACPLKFISTDFPKHGAGSFTAA